MDFKFQNEDALYAMLLVYADESQTSEKVPVIAVGGGVGTGLEWKNLSRAWKSALDKEPTIDIFHTTDFETPEGRIGTVYEHWDISRRETFNSYLTGAICYYQIEKVFVFAVKPDEFEEVKNSRSVKYSSTWNAYYFCSYMLIEQIAFWANKYFPKEKVTYIFEQGGLHQKGIEQAYEAVKNDEASKAEYKLWKTPIFAPKDAYCELQIADKLVYEGAKHISHFFDEAPPEKHSVISEAGKRVWKDRFSAEQWVRSGLDVDIRYLRKHEIEDFFDMHEKT